MKITSWNLWAAAVIALLLVGCSTANHKKNPPKTGQNKKPTEVSLLIKDTDTLNPTTNLSPADINEDLRILIYALENGYGGRKFVPQNNFQSALLHLKGFKRPEKKDYSSWDFCRDIEDALVQIPDMHMMARIKYTLCSDKRKAKFKTGTVGKNINLSKEKPWELSYRKVAGRNVPILAINHFPGHEDKVWEGFTKTLGDLKMNAPTLIVDLRGNGGGDDTIGWTLAGYMYGQEAPGVTSEIIKSQTPATLALAANGVKFKMMALKEHQKEIPQYLTDSHFKFMSQYNDALEGKLPTERKSGGHSGFPYDPQKAYKKPIMFLIDSECASSCESTIEAFEAHPYAITVGERTGGFCHFGNIGYLVLPHSQVVIQLATDFWRYKDNRYVEGLGYAPKIAVPSGQDALEVAIKHLRPH